MKCVLPFLLALTSAGCAYYNGMWSAERYAKDARKAERRGQLSEARSQWAQAAVKAERVALRHPRSRWADDALTLQAEGLARSGACDEAADVITRVRASVTDQALLERVALVAAECALSARQLTQAEAAVAPALASRDDSRRSRAELLAGQTAALRLDYDGAVTHFERSHETAARPAHAHALIAAERTGAAARVIESLTGPEFDTDRADLLARLATAPGGGPDSASATLDRLLARGKRIPLQEQARLLTADADRRLAHGDHDAAAARYRRAAAIAPVGTPEAGMAALGIQRVLIAGTRERSELKPIEAELARLSREPGAVAAKRLLDLVGQTALIPETPAAGFRAAEFARDSLGAPALAGSLFLDLAARDTASLYAPKALVAAIAMLPERRDSIIAELDARYATSPYTRAFHGEPSVAYAAAEDSLARALGMQIARSVAGSAGAGMGNRVDLPVPGPRGPHLEDADLARAQGRARPTNRAAPAAGRPPPPPPPATPERP